MDQKYTAYFRGKLRKGHDKDYVSVALSVKMGLSPKKIESLFRGKSTKIKSNLNKDEALFLAKKFYHCGLILHVKKIKNKVNDERLSDKEKLEKQNFTEMLSGQCHHPKVSLANKLCVFLNLLLALALPLIYFSFVVLLVYGLYQYLIEILPKLVASTQGVYYHIIFKFIPPIIGFIFLTFLMKPLISPYRLKPCELLRRPENSRFYELIDAIAGYVGSRKPAMIFVNNGTYAKASFYGGIKGFLNGKMVLVIGMPLVNGLTVRQLSGVVAHEFGHFSQTGTVRMRSVINLINSWLYSRAYEDDIWDEKIKILQKKSSLSIWQVMLGLYSLCVALVRAIMVFLLNISVKSSYFLSKKMEFDADSYEVEVAGSKTFKSVSLRLRLLNMAQHEVREINDHSYEKTFQLFEDMPSAIIDVIEHYDEDVVSMIKEEMSQIQMNVWGSHPADNMRIKHAESLNKKGKILIEFPAKIFFSDIERLNKRVTYNYYHQYLSILNPRGCMVQNAQIKP